MIKPGHPLEQITGFAPAARRTLPNELSVTTAEEFLALSSGLGNVVAELLGISSAGLARLEQAARAPLSAKEVREAVTPVNTPFRTGHDSPNSTEVG